MAQQIKTYQLNIDTPLLLNADPSVNLGAATKQYVDNFSDTAKVDVSGDTMTGALILNADPSVNLGAATKQYVDNFDDTAKVDISGDTMTGALILNADPSVNLGAATKQYVDNFDDTAKVDVSGDTMTGALILNADPTVNLGAATKQYVDTNAGNVTLTTSDAAGLEYGVLSNGTFFYADRVLVPALGSLLVTLPIANTNGTLVLFSSNHDTVTISGFSTTQITINNPVINSIISVDYTIIAL